jgi:hypothetical protein
VFSRRQAPVDSRNCRAKAYPVLFAAPAPFDIMKVDNVQKYVANKRDMDKATSPFGNRWAAIRCRNALLANCKSAACDLHNAS